MMKKVIFLLFGVLALASCTKESDAPVFPNVQPTGETMLLATQGFPGYPEMIFDIKGDTVYLCEDTEHHILSLTTEGSDWYARLSNDAGNYCVVKNGETVYSTPRVIADMAVEGGIVYTVEVDKQDDTRWVYRDFMQLYELDKKVNYNTFFVQDGNVFFTINTLRPYTWWNGRTISFEGIDEGFAFTYGMDRTNDDILIVYQGYTTRRDKYYWHSAVHDLPEKFAPWTCRIVNGHAIVLGQEKTSSGIGGVNGVPAVIIDGVETLLSEQKGFAAVQVAQQGMDTYILVNDVRSDSGRSMLYRNMQQVTMPSNIVIPQELLQHYSQYGTMISLTELGIIDIAS